MAEWVRAFWAGDRTVSRPGSNPATVTSLRNFGNSVYRALPVSFGGDTKSRRSLLSGVYARGSKRSHQSALECVTVVDSTTHSKLPDPQSAIMWRKTLPCTCIGRRRRRIPNFQVPRPNGFFSRAIKKKSHFWGDILIILPPAIPTHATSLALACTGSGWTGSESNDGDFLYVKHHFAVYPLHTRCQRHVPRYNVIYLT